MGLKNIPAVINPDLLHALSSMGHGDEIGKENKIQFAKIFHNFNFCSFSFIRYSFSDVVHVQTRSRSNSRWW